MGYKGKIALCFIMLTLGGCSRDKLEEHFYYESGVWLTDEQVGAFPVGTDMSAIIKALGKPQKTKKIGGSVILAYTYEKYSRLPFSVKPNINRTVVFKFDGKSRLQGYWKRSSGL